ncbi:MAG: GTP cyclohydrolase II [Myxococcaceae bacterium]|nr:GTP cyclohydrolase II [Myxococcaceae bacterium]
MSEPRVLPTRLPPSVLERFAESDLPTTRGTFRLVVFREKKTGKEHVAMVRGKVSGAESVPVRIHSECLTSEVFGSLRCDCRAQLDLALDTIAQRGTGVLLYLRQEGRGIGLGNKIKAYALQLEEGLDTVEANNRLGFPDDLRRYDVAAEMLRSLGVLSVDLMTNNPLKIAGLVDQGMAVRRRIPSRTQSNPLNVDYLRTKRDRSGHLIEFLAEESSETKAG